MKADKFNMTEGITFEPGSKLLSNEIPNVRKTKTSNYTAAAGELIQYDTTGGEFTIQLPSSPLDGDRVGFLDVGGFSKTKKLTIDQNSAGRKIMGITETLKININYASFSLEYNETTNDWRII